MAARPLLLYLALAASSALASPLFEADPPGELPRFDAEPLWSPTYEAEAGFGVPSSGHGLVASGSLVLGGSGAMMVASVVLFATARGDSAQHSLGAASVIVGSLGVSRSLDVRFPQPQHPLMSHKSLLMTIGLCFGVGVGLAPMLSTAHAFKCDVPWLTLELEAVEGTADPTLEEETWSADATIEDFGDRPVLSLDGQSLTLEQL